MTAVQASTPYSDDLTTPESALLAKGAVHHILTQSDYRSYTGHVQEIPQLEVERPGLASA